MAMLARMKENEMNMAQYYVQVVDYMGEIANGAAAHNASLLRAHRQQS